MKRIGVISDTHVPDRQSFVPDEIISGLQGVDLIIHAGDFTSLSVLDSLARIAKVEACCGNMDGEDVRSELRPVNMFEFEGKKIAVMHGAGSPSATIEKARTSFPDRDIVVFGHTHSPYLEMVGNTLVLNPGSAWGGLMSRPSYGIITIHDDGSVEAQHFTL